MGQKIGSFELSAGNSGASGDGEPLESVGVSVGDPVQSGKPIVRASRSFETSAVVVPPIVRRISSWFDTGSDVPRNRERPTLSHATHHTGWSLRNSAPNHALNAISESERVDTERRLGCPPLQKTAVSIRYFLHCGTQREFGNWFSLDGR